MAVHTIFLRTIELAHRKAPQYRSGHWGALDAGSFEAKARLTALLDKILHEVIATVPPLLYMPPPCMQRSDKEVVLAFLSKGALNKEGKGRSSHYVCSVVFDDGVHHSSLRVLDEDATSRTLRT